MITINGVKYKLTPVENETVNKTEPKFKVGDWIVSNFNTVCYVESISEKNYYLQLTNGFHERMSINYVDRNFHLWTIADAKDGDVIFYDDGWTCIFKNIHGIWYSSYCFITADGEFHTGYERHAVDAKLNGNANPATKEQRDILMKAMANAGWEFDFEKKELKKISQHIVSAEAKEALYDKPTWSEEDEKMIQDIISDITIAQEQVYCKNRCEDEINWLKSLRPQNHWKPSD